MSSISGNVGGSSWTNTEAVAESAVSGADTESSASTAAEASPSVVRGSTMSPAGGAGVYGAGLASQLHAMVDASGPGQASGATLGMGDRGPQVASFQKALQQFGASLKGKIETEDGGEPAVVRDLKFLRFDGDFGPGTKAAVLAFQQHNNLPQTGELDPATQAKLSEVTVSGAASDAKESVTATDIAMLPTMQEGDSSDAVKLLQKGLRQLARKSEYSEELRASFDPGEVDGKLGDSTVKAIVSLLSKDGGLDFEGTVTPGILKTLQNEIRRQEEFGMIDYF